MSAAPVAGELAPGESRDTFLGGRVKARQPASGYRAGLDAVLLGAAITAKPGARLVELGCGAGVAALIAAARNPGVSILGLERSPESAALARENAAANDAALEVREGDLFAAWPELREQFDQAFLNPPFYNDPAAVRAPKTAGRAAAFLDTEHGLADWLAAALGLVKTRGLVTVIHRADRLGEILAAFEAVAGDIRVRAVHPRAGEAASRVVVRARKGARAPLRVLPGFVLYDGEAVSAEAAAVNHGAKGFALEA